MSEWIRKINWKYVVVMLIGNIILGLGIAIFKLSGLGNDPFSGMVMALAECVGIEYARFLILLNLLLIHPLMLLLTLSYSLQLSIYYLFHLLAQLFFVPTLNLSYNYSSPL